jgi:hypothetical protein
MVAARLASAALRIPWGDLLKTAPDLLTAAGELVARLGDRRRGPVEQVKSSAEVAALVTRLEALETSGVSQADLTKEMASQLKEVTEALRIVALRMLVALGFSLVALVLGLAAFIRTFL